jgi:hypothetical protein
MLLSASPKQQRKQQQQQQQQQQLSHPLHQQLSPSSHATASIKNLLAATCSTMPPAPPRSVDLATAPASGALHHNVFAYPCIPMLLACNDIVCRMVIVFGFEGVLAV